MKLFELQAYKQNPGYQAVKQILSYKPVHLGSEKRKAFKEFSDFLEMNDWKPISSGLYGFVFTHPDLDYVIKVFKHDDGYLRFVRYAQNNPSPYLPKFRGKIMRIDDGLFAVRMEKLEECPATMTWALDLISNFADGHDSLPDFIKKAKSSEYWLRCKAVIEANPGIMELVDELRKFRVRYMDLHAGNFMMRGKTLVITDPYSQ